MYFVNEKNVSRAFVSVDLAKNQYQHSWKHPIEGCLLQGYELSREILPKNALNKSIRLRAVIILKSL